MTRAKAGNRLRTAAAVICLLLLVCSCARRPFPESVPDSRQGETGESSLPEPSVPPETIPEGTSASREETAASAAFSSEKAETEASSSAALPESETAGETAEPTLKKLLRTALGPVGRAMYVWGGGWNEADDGAGREAVTIGPAPAWEAFAETASAGYDPDLFEYRIHDGLDCSGYLGWVLYNTLETEDGRPGYVAKSTDLAASLADRGLGTLVPEGPFLPGDIVSLTGHVWLALGTCADGSVLLVHASPPGVQISGTLLPDGGESEASRLAKQLMEEHSPEWAERFPACSRPASYLEAKDRFRFDPAVLGDPEGLAGLAPEELMKILWEGQTDGMD